MPAPLELLEAGDKAREIGSNVNWRVGVREDTSPLIAFYGAIQRYKHKLFDHSVSTDSDITVVTVHASLPYFSISAASWLKDLLDRNHKGMRQLSYPSSLYACSYWLLQTDKGNAKCDN